MIEPIKEELRQKLVSIATKENALLLSFIAPDRTVRISPSKSDYASISTVDLYSIESNINDLKEKDELPKKLHLIVHTPGGVLRTSVKIAKFLQANFEVIEAYVPYEAASGGTIICLTANEIIMDEASNLTSIDPQLPYKGHWVSATTFDQITKDFRRDYGKLKPEEIPSPYQQMCNSLDPIIVKEMEKSVVGTIFDAYNLIKGRKKIKINDDQAVETAISLTRNRYSHEHVLDAKESQELGLPISHDKNKAEYLKLYKEWVSLRLNEEERTHIVERVLPNLTVRNDEKKLNVEQVPSENAKKKQAIRKKRKS